ncbi:MAG: hypothetical protein ACYC2K_01200 [Gemmatimonadales bacterium]
MDRNLANTAAALREGIIRGFLSNADAIAWADSEVGDDPEEASILLSELALGENQPTPRILNMLGQLAWGADLSVAGRIAASYLHDRLADGLLQSEVVVDAIHYLARDGFAPDPWFERGAQRLHDETGSVGPQVDALLTFLNPYRHDAPGAEQEPPPATHDQIVIAMDPSAPELSEAEVSVFWQSWSGHARIRTTAAQLAELADSLRDFSGHRADRIVFAPDLGADGDRLTATVIEYGRARRAAVLVEITSTDFPSELGADGGNTLRATVPTEHALLGDFAADLGELISTGGGIARLRLSARWPHDT